MSYDEAPPEKPEQKKPHKEINPQRHKDLQILSRLPDKILEQVVNMNRKQRRAYLAKTRKTLDKLQEQTERALKKPAKEITVKDLDKIFDKKIAKTE